MNASRGPLLGIGREAEVFAWGDRQVLKLFPPNWPTAAVEYEARATCVAYSSGVNTPRVDEVIERDGRLGIIFERVDGPTMLHVVTTQPWHLWPFARSFAELHFAVHQCTAPQLHSARRSVEGRIQNAPALSADLKRAALRAWAQLPDGDRLCHGDLHPDQIIVSPQGLVIIDWADALRGHPWADVARTSLILRFSPLPPGTPLPMRLITHAFRRLFHSEYLRHYFQLSSATKEPLAAWEAPLAAARLCEEIPGERERLLRLVGARLDDLA
ncbi:MAG: phosphotransferase [Deltaproteobacteria bacterium]|nr:phosphotransferase [Deltaproteobacteria bacterium]